MQSHIDCIGKIFVHKITLVFVGSPLATPYLKEITEMQSLRKLILILQVEPSEIGIISPYRRQVQKIRDLMNRKFQNKYRDWKNITVGSTEEFQGENEPCWEILIIELNNGFVLRLLDTFYYIFEVKCA